MVFGLFLGPVTHVHSLEPSTGAGILRESFESADHERELMAPLLFGNRPAPFSSIWIFKIVNIDLLRNGRERRHKFVCQFHVGGGIGYAFDKFDYVRCNNKKTLNLIFIANTEY